MGTNSSFDHSGLIRDSGFGFRRPAKNQMAHEVTRAVTAWALVGLRRHILVSNRFYRQPAPGPGPASVRSA